MLTEKFRSISLEEFSSADIGAPRLRGETNLCDGGVDVVAAGADIWGTRDEFRFVYLERDGNFDIAVRVESLGFADPYTKAGIMARESLSDDSRHAYLQVFPDNSARNNNNGGYEYQYRLHAGGEMKAIYPDSCVGEPQFPVKFPNTWMRLARKGDVFIGYYGDDMGHWKIFGVLEIVLRQRLLLGMAVTSHNAGEYTTARFRDIVEARK